MDTTDTRAIDDVIAKHGLEINAEFIPWSKSRNASEKGPSLNWKVTLTQKGRKIITTDYMAGCGHAPFYKKIKSYKMTIWERNNIIEECEKGFPVTKSGADSALGISFLDRKHPIMPDAKDVIYSLLMDAEVLEYSSFEEWADMFGYDADSRKAEKTYQECMKIALKINQIGNDAIAELREAYQNY